MSLRRRLVVGLLVLVVAAIAVTDVVTYSSLRSFLVGRLDEQTDVAQSKAYLYLEATYRDDRDAGEVAAGPAAARRWLDSLAASDTCADPGAASVGAIPERSGGATAGARPLEPGILVRELNPDVWLEVLDSTGKPVFCDASGTPQHPDPAPRLPRHMPVQSVPAHVRFGGSHGPFLPNQPSFTTGARGAPGTYRAQALAVPGGILVTAISTAPTDATVTSLLHVELIVSALVVLAALIGALLIVRLGLAPLNEMTETADAIAAGELTRRVRHADERNEVGRLGRALNGMLSQIEAAFVERSRSEGRLRRFVADASHELRTPLTAIRGYAELLRKGAIADERGRVRAAGRIEEEAARMGLLVDDLLLLARLDQGRPLERAPVDLGRLVRRAVEDARTGTGQRPVTVDAPAGVVVDGDAARLRQIVDNLLGNALVHTPPGTPVRVSVAGRGAEAVLEVSDEGPGLTPEQAERVFDRFYRGTTTRTTEGSGLGLSIVAALAAAHGGQASVSSTPGAGATFTVTLPRSAGSEPAGPEARPEPAPPADPAHVVSPGPR